MYHERKIYFEKDIDRKSIICEDILNDLPDWFGQPESILEYKNTVKKLPFLVISFNNEVIGFCAIKIEHIINCDLYVLGIKYQYHKQGIGSILISYIEKYCIENNIPYMTVLTLSDRDNNEHYRRTRKFYKKNGFVKFKELPTLWDKSTPALLMIKQVG